MAHSEISRVTRSKAQARTAYDRISRWYDWLAASSERPLAEIGLHNLNPRDGETVLEIGCGTGHAILAIASAVGVSGRVHGVDLSHGMLSIAMRKILHAIPSARVVLEQGDGIHLPFAIKSFDAIFLSFALELFDTPEIPLVLSECRRVLKPSGRICVVAMARDEKENLPQRMVPSIFACLCGLPTDLCPVIIKSFWLSNKGGHAQMDVGASCGYLRCFEARERKR